MVIIYLWNNWEIEVQLLQLLPLTQIDRCFVYDLTWQLLCTWPYTNYSCFMGITLHACCDVYASIQYAGHTFTQLVFFKFVSYRYQTKCLNDSTLKNSKLQVDTDFLDTELMTLVQFLSVMLQSWFRQDFISDTNQITINSSIKSAILRTLSYHFLVDTTLRNTGCVL